LPGRPLSKYQGEEEKMGMCVRVITVPDGMKNRDAETTYLPFISPFPPDNNKINCSLAPNVSMHNIVPQTLISGWSLLLLLFLLLRRHTFSVFATPSFYPKLSLA
jgi:hypothetical protein